MSVMKKIRNEYTERLEFVVADINTLEGKTFTQRNGYLAAALVFYSADGRNLKTLFRRPWCG
ncbi:MAG: hypothetical protein KF908_02735 [Nitrosomonas sp.]|nr:hypothetical protein [Nitrosomonas sp.]MCW5606745.1 hypothetical protein [Nitrosomonas sp.]